jgi:hypothetical protein
MPGYVMSIWGPEKSQKSSLAYTGPKILRVYDFDMGYERAIWRFRDEEEAGRITCLSCPTPVHISIKRNEPLKGFRELWAKFVQDYMESLQNPNIKSIVIDTATQCWSICIQAYLQELQENQLAILPRNPASGEVIIPQGFKMREQLQPIEYREPNNRMRAVEQAGKGFGKNLILTHYQSATYGKRMVEGQVEDYDTGEKELDGFKHTQNLSDIVLRTAYVDNTPRARVVLCGLSMNMVGVELDNPTWDGVFESLDRMRSI